MKYIKSYKVYEAQQGEVKTWGGLKAMINSLITKKKLDAVKSGAVNVLAEQLVGLIPGGGNIKSAFDFFKGIYSASDDKKTKSWLDKLNVDDNYSKIVDDAIENQFIKHLAEMVNSKNNDEELPQDFNINTELSNWLANKYQSRTLTYRR
jgi:hypothetical protein